MRIECVSVNYNRDEFPVAMVTVLSKVFGSNSGMQAFTIFVSFIPVNKHVVLKLV